MTTNPIYDGIIDPERLFEDLEQSVGLPSHFYHDQTIYQFDLEAIWRREWQYFAPAEKLRDKGDVVVGYAGDIPVLVARAEDGALHGAVNICRHRGYQVQNQSAKKCRRLVCPYHAWSYSLNGDLFAAPGSKDETGFPKEDLGLKPIAVEEWGPGVYVNANADAAARLDCYPGLTDAIEKMEIDLNPDRYVFHSESIHRVNANWKVWFDNFVECYHCDNIHAGSFSAAYNSDIRSVETQFHDRFMANRFQPKNDPSPTELRAMNYRSSVSFPGGLILQQDDLMILSQMRPTGPESTIQLVHYFAERGSDPGRVQQWIDLWEQTFTEDGQATEIQQIGLRTDAVPRSHLVKSREEAVFFFNQATCSAYKRFLSDEPSGQNMAAE